MKFLALLRALFSPAPRASPADWSARLRAGTALLVDVREPGEWSSGVADRAALLPLSDLDGPRHLWRDFLARAGDREVLLYCASGLRSGVAARTLAQEGLRAANAGGLSAWAAAGWPIVRPKAAGSDRRR